MSTLQSERRPARVAEVKRHRLSRQQPEFVRKHAVTFALNEGAEEALANTAAFYQRCGVTASGSIIVRRALALLAEHVAGLGEGTRDAEAEADTLRRRFA